MPKKSSQKPAAPKVVLVDPPNPAPEIKKPAGKHVQVHPVVEH